MMSLLAIKAIKISEFVLKQHWRVTDAHKPFSLLDIVFYPSFLAVWSRERKNTLA